MAGRSSPPLSRPFPARSLPLLPGEAAPLPPPGAPHGAVSRSWSRSSPGPALPLPWDWGTCLSRPGRRRRGLAAPEVEVSCQPSKKWIIFQTMLRHL
ncbi:unnamed protein product [Caretta caretta]